MPLSLQAWAITVKTCICIIDQYDWKKYKYVRNKVGFITFGFVIRSKAREKLMTFLLKLSFYYVLAAISTSSLISENGCLN